MRSWVFALIIGAFTSLAFAQEVKVALKDTSAASSPLLLSGTVVSDASGSRLTLTAKNVGAKQIIAYFAEMNAFGDVSWLSHDYFFLPFVIEPGDVVEVDSLDSEVFLGPAHHPPEAWVLYVQFTDGTTWGDKAFGKKISARRPKEIAFLEKLLSAYENQGESVFLDYLRTETDPDLHVCDFQAQSGTPAALDCVKERLNSAQASLAAGVH